MKPVYHKLSVFCVVCGALLPGKAEHFAEKVGGQHSFFCRRDRNLIVGRRKIRPTDIQRVEDGMKAPATPLETGPKTGLSLKEGKIVHPSTDLSILGL
jgi:hypothetical protein